MKDIIQIQKKIVPDLLETIEKRFAILKEIQNNTSIGRRALSVKLSVSERVIRSEVDFLKKEQLIDVAPAGMTVTAMGYEVLDQLSEFISELRGLNTLGNRLEELLGIKKVLVVPTSYKSNPEYKKELGKAAAQYFLKQLSPGHMIGITGGTTMYEFVQCVPKQKENLSLKVVAARGGLGEQFEIQANNVAAILASRLNAKYKLLQIPDNLSKEVLHQIAESGELKGIMEWIKRIDTFVFGIGQADEMAERRSASQEELDYIGKNHAVAESFGYYFNLEGQIVMETSTAGITLEDYQNLSSIIGVAGGEGKAEALLATSKINPNLVIVTDEDTAHNLFCMVSPNHA